MSDKERIPENDINNVVLSGVVIRRVLLHKREDIGGYPYIMFLVMSKHAWISQGELRVTSRYQRTFFFGPGARMAWQRVRVADKVFIAGRLSFRRNSQRDNPDSGGDLSVIIDQITSVRPSNDYRLKRSEIPHWIEVECSRYKNVIEDDKPDNIEEDVTSDSSASPPPDVESRPDATLPQWLVSELERAKPEQ